MICIYFLSLALLFSLQEGPFCFAAPTELEGPTIIPSCDVATPVPCDFTNSLEDVQTKIDAMQNSLFNGSGKSYVDCAECTYYREWEEAVVFWSKPNGTHALWFHWQDSRHWWLTWSRMNATIREQIGYPVANPVPDQHPEDLISSSYIQYQRGRVYNTFRRVLFGPIYEKFLSAGGAAFLGTPATEIRCYFLSDAPDREFCNISFQTTRNWISFINWDSKTGAHVVDRRLWPERRIWKHGVAVTDPLTIRDTDLSYQEFWNPPDATTAILWNNTETWIMQPDIWRRYQRTGGFNHHLGLPITNATGTVEERLKWKVGMWGRAYGEYQDFAHGSLYASYTDHDRNLSSDWRVTAVHEYAGSLQDPPESVDFAWNTGGGINSVKATFTYAPSAKEARLSTQLSLGPEAQGNFTLTCILRDGDGQFYTFDHTEAFAGGIGGLPQVRFNNKVVANDTELKYADARNELPQFNINWRALLFANPLECRVGRDVDLTTMKDELVRFAMSMGSFTFKRGVGPRVPYIIELS
jgi:hypothetical protein